MNDKAKADIHQWCEFARDSLHVTACETVFNGKWESDDLDAFNALLRDRTFLVAERFSLADVATAAEVAAVLAVVESNHAGSARQKWPHLTRWFNTIAAQPAVKKVMGETKV